MKIAIVDKPTALARLEVPFNPPKLSTTFTEADFRNEWYTARDALKLVLDSFGVWDAYGEGDYYIDDAPSSTSRGIGVEVTNPAFLTKSLVKAVQTLLHSFREDFDVHFALMRDSVFFDVFVSRDAVIASDDNLISDG